MGCGASSTRTMAVDDTKIGDADRLTSMNQSLFKPVVGGQPADIVQGAPAIPGSADSTDLATTDAESNAAKLTRQVRIVKGLASAATALIAINPTAAAGLAMAAADVAEAMPHGPEAAQAPANSVASGFAASALAAAQAGSAVAPGLIEAAIGSAVDVAQARSNCDMK